MVETDKDPEAGKGRVSHLEIVTRIVVAGTLLYVLVLLGSRYDRGWCIYEPLCQSNVHQLALVFKMYSDEHGGKYPPAERWNDVLKEHLGEGNYEEMFICPKAESRKGCSYAINPKAKANVRHVMVLMFESSNGWNKYGGAELMCFDNHADKQCHVLFNDFSVRKVKPEEVDQLRWE